MFLPPISLAMSMHVMGSRRSYGLAGPIRIRFRDQIRSYLGVKEPSLYKERRYVIQGKQEL